MALIGLIVAPLILSADQNGGISTLGFRFLQPAPLERNYKIRYDYLTGRLFAAQRVDTPTFKHLN